MKYSDAEYFLLNKMQYMNVNGVGESAKQVFAGSEHFIYLFINYK